MKYFDTHTHTCPASYCAEPEVTFETYLDKSSSVAGFVNTDHAMHFYFPQEVVEQRLFVRDPKVFDQYRDFGNRRLAAHLDKIKQFAPIIPGLETEMMTDGRLTLDPDLRSEIKLLIGSLHYFKYNKKNGFSDSEIIREFRNHTFALLDSGIDVLGHPFRWLSFQVSEIPDSLVIEVVKRAIECNVALELNSHYLISTDKLMVKTVAQYQGLLSLGSDSHRLDEVGNLEYHNNLLESLAIPDLKILSF